MNKKENILLLERIYDFHGNSRQFSQMHEIFYLARYLVVLVVIGRSWSFHRVVVMGDFIIIFIVKEELKIYLLL